MKKGYSILIFSILSYGNAMGQAAMIKTTDIEKNFTQKSIAVYQQNSMNKISELYQYLTLYSDKNTAASLKKQLKDNIFSLFKSENIKLFDFLSQEGKTIDLSLLLNKIENKSYEFNVKPPYNYSDPENNNWFTQYHLIVTNSFYEYNFIINQKIYFSPDEKSFGTKNKVVWDLKLGDQLSN